MVLELLGGEDLSDSVDLFLSDPPCTVRRQQEFQIGDDEVFNAKDMEAFWDFADYVLKRGGH